MPRTQAGFEESVAPPVAAEPKATALPQTRAVKVLALERSARRSAPTRAAELRGLVERAVVEATNGWTARDSEAPAHGSFYELLSIIGEAISQVLLGGSPELQGWPTSAPIREPVERMRRALLDQASLSEVPRVHADDVLVVLRALERVQETALADSSRRFAEQLSTGNALELVVGVAHDMRSPLSSILFLVETLRNAYRSKSTAVEERQLGLVYGAAMGLSQLVSDVIELARGCDRLLDREAIPFSISELLNGVLRLVQPIAEEKRLAIYTQLPQVDARVGYPAALSRVMLNLVTNALKFTNEGYVEISLHQRSRTAVEFSVRDTGPGIPDAELSTLYQALRKRTRSKGQVVLSSSGLGLSICQRLVSAMGGQLHVQTELGRETRFHFVLDLPPATKI